MKSVFLISSFVSPETRYTSLDFKTYLDSLVANILTALLVFFAFVLFVYILYMAVRYVIFFWNQMKESKTAKHETYQEQTIENIVV